ncbi:MAG: hypothetical protein HY885_05655 [Deltaproteobacteria bacterium]|nr:hypothetical protein [Deltaproteobacteria bacterium]
MYTKNSLNLWDRLMMAITFAESGEHETAKNILDPVKENRKGNEKRINDQNSNRPELRL